MNFKYLSWGTNFLSFLLFIYLFIKAINSPCFDLMDTAISLIVLFLSISEHFLEVIFEEVLK